MFDLSGPFFRPLWRRVALVAVILGWAAIEFITGSPFWGTLFLGMGGWSIYQFFIKEHQDNHDD